MNSNSPEKTLIAQAKGSQGLELKEDGLAQGLMCPLSSDLNCDFRKPLIPGLTICFLYTPCASPWKLARPSSLTFTTAINDQIFLPNAEGIYLILS